MTESSSTGDGKVERIRTPRSAAVAGLAFSLLLALALVLVRRSVPSLPGDLGEWLTNRSKRNAVILAMNLVPFAGIAFLWFLGVVRDRIGLHEDRFFATVFLGSGLLFIAMLFASAASASGLLLAAGDGGGLPSADTWAFGRRATSTLLNIYAMRMAAVFAISTTTILARMELKVDRFDREKIEGTTLSREKVLDYMFRLWSLSLAERRTIPGLPGNRADVILMGVAIYETVMEQFDFPHLYVSMRGLRHGALLQDS